jgi:peptide/nickel transport system permease protein
MKGVEGCEKPGEAVKQALIPGGGFYSIDPMFMILPGAAIFITVLAFNLFGDGLRDALDPKGIR